MKKLQHIGTIELISLPDEVLEAIPAKIDTGADSSAIWASNITETENHLSFVLFDRGSPFYSGKVLTTEEYEVASVKNSFGQSEYRYKVKLRIQLGGRTIRARFTLANRENNKYPVLIGRRTLHGKFLVDVTRRPEKDELHVLMLSTKRTDVTAKFAANVEKSGKKLKVTYAAYEDLVYLTGGDTNQICLRDTDRDIASFDFVHFKTTARLMDVAAATARYLEKRDVPFIDEAIKHFPATSKLYQYVLLTDEGIDVPRSVYFLPSALPESFGYLSEQLGLPFVLKDIHGNKGEYNYLIRTKKDYTDAVLEAEQAGVSCIAQAFVANDGDYRVLVFGHKIALVIERKRTDDTTHLNNTSQGAQARIVPATTLPPAVQTACIAGAKVMERQVAGVDIVHDKNSGVWYCLEVNDGPQLASGSFTAEKHQAFADYLERKLN